MQKTAEEIDGVINNLRRIYQAINEYSRKAERETQLTGPQLWVLQLLANSTMRVSDLARQMYLRPATVVGILDRLETKGLVTRVRSLEDRRSVNVVLTEKGGNLVRQAPQVAQVMLLEGLEALPDEDFTVVAEGMKGMARLLGAQDFTPQPLHS